MNQPALRLVHPDTGEQVEPADITDLRAELEAARALASDRLATVETQAEKIRDLTNAAKFREAGRAKAATKGALASDIRDVLLYHGSRFLSPGFKVIPDSKGWQFVEALLTAQDASTGKPAFTPSLLCESVDGAWLDDWYRQEKWRGYATNIFGSFQTNAKGQRYEAADPDKVQRNIDRLRQKKGEAALAVRGASEQRRDEFLIWLSEPCGCGHLRVVHLDATGGCGHFDGQQPCKCERFDHLGIDSWKAQSSPEGEGS